MFKIMGLVLTITLPFLGALEPQHRMFSKYKEVEAYEVRPGILVMPRYSKNGQVCEVGLEKLHYMREKVVLSSELSREEIHRIFDELAPVNERGSRPTNLVERGDTEVEGNAQVENEVYENVSLHIYSEGSLASSERGTVVSDVAATIDWNRPGCR